MSKSNPPAEVPDERHVGRPVPERCECHACIAEHDLRGPGGLPLAMTRMVLCPICGNKRCPRATDHRNACTGSNDAGQRGSLYGGCCDYPHCNCWLLGAHHQGACGKGLPPAPNDRIQPLR